MKKKTKWTRKRLIALGIPAVFIPGFLTAILLGWNPAKLLTVNNYHDVKTLFPKTGIVKDVYDGDTFQLNSGVEVRLLGVNAPGRGEKNYTEAKEYLATTIDSTRVFLEYDRYQDDKFGRVLAWIWIDCETEPTFLSSDYMHLSGNASREGLTDNPEGCTKGRLVNEHMVDRGYAHIVLYRDRGELKYEKRLRVP